MWDTVRIQGYPARTTFQAEQPETLFGPTVQAAEISSADLAFSQEPVQRFLGDLDAKGGACFSQHVFVGPCLLRFFIPGAKTRFALAAASTPSLIGRGNDMTPFRSDLYSFVAHEEKPFQRDVFRIEPALEGSAAKWTYFPEALGVDEDLLLSVIVVMEQVGQLPGRAAVEVTNRSHVEVSFAFLVSN
ncbi:MAG: hypothetical protein ACLFNV_03805 [Desulfovibrionales bacterium]